MLAAELHSHSALSHDGRDPVEMLVEQASAVGLDVLAVTDHDEIDASLRAVELAAEVGIVGIPGIEVSTGVGHILGLGVEERIEPGLSFGETLDRIHARDGLAVVPHPFQKSRHGVAPHVSQDELTAADAIEVFNSRLLTGRGNRKAETFAVNRGLPMVAGSDAHIAEMVGQAVTHLGAEKRTRDAVLDAIREGRTSVVGRRTPWRVSVRQAAGGAKRRVKRRLTELL